MPVDMKLLRSRAVSSGDWKKIFTAEPADYPSRITKLIDLLRNRAVEGYEASFREWRAYHAIDLAYDVPFNQTTPTLVNNILSKKLDATETKNELKAFGLDESELFMTVKMDGRDVEILNPPVFYQIFIPLVKAYSMVRVASLYNERNTSPVFPLKPLKDTEANGVKCAVWEDILNTIGTWYGYNSVKRQLIQQACKYGVALAFTREEWHYEQQLFNNDLDPLSPEKLTTKEGLRYAIPHPTRMFYDLQYPLTSLNTDTGCEFAGHWNVRRYGEILDNRMYWNRSKIFPGQNWFANPLATNYFKEVFPCVLKFPTQESNGMLREDRQAFYHQRSDRDTAVFVNDQICRLVPYDWGLGNYKYPVWARFTIAGDNTVIWAEPSAYCPAVFAGYDYDENAARNPSLALELIPWQDHLGNILSQMLLTAKQNLANVIFYNNQAVDKGDIDKLTNFGERKYRGMNFIGFDGLKLAVSRIDVDKIFHNVQFNKQSVQEFIQMLPVLLSIMERVLQISAQEAGSQATHQQSRTEVMLTGQGSSNRKNFTASFIDECFDAMARQNVEGALAYMDPDFLVTISSEIENLDRIVAELGFTVKGRTQRNITLTGKKHLLRLEGFAASSKGPDPTHDKELAQGMFQAVGMVAGNPNLIQIVGGKTLIKLIEHAAIMGGAPKDFKLPPMEGQDQGGLTPAIINAIKQAQAATMQTVEQKIAQPAAQEMHQAQTQMQQMQEAIKSLQRIAQVAEANNDRLNVERAKAQQEMQIKQQEFAANEHRKDLELQAKLKRENIATGAKIQRETSLTKAKIHSDVAKTAAQVHTDALAKAQTENAAAKAEPSTKQKVAESINYKDAPPTIQRQIEQQAGLTPAPNSERATKKDELDVKKKAAAKKPASSSGK